MEVSMVYFSKHFSKTYRFKNSKHGKSFQMRDKLNRSKYCVTILLLSLEIVAGVMLLCITTYFHCILTAYLPKTERQLLLSQMSNIYILAFELLICFSLGFIVWHYIFKSDTITEHSKLLILWNSFCTLTVVCGSATVWFQYSNIESLQKAYAASLFQGIDLYFTDPEWKLLWDEIQYHNECCGVFGFKDWEEASWIPEEQEECLQLSDLSHSMVMIPYACCKRSSTSCFESFAPHGTNIRDLNKELSDINVDGCLPKFNNLTSQLCHIVSCIWGLSLIPQIILLAYILCLILRSKKITFNALVCSEESDERPLVVVKYPRNVRCITLTDEETFGDEQEEEEGFRQRCSNCITEEASIRQDIFDTCNARQNVFVH